MAHDLAPAGIDFLDTAPIMITHTEVVGAPLEAVWQAVSEPGPWVEWFDAVKSCDWTSRETRCVGATRTIEIGPAGFDEEFIAWDDDHRLFRFMVTSTTLPVARRLVEGVEVTGEDGSATVTWRSAIEPRSRLVPKGLLRGAFARGLARGFGGLGPYLDSRG